MYLKKLEFYENCTVNYNNRKIGVSNGFQTSNLLLNCLGKSLEVSTIYLQ